MHLLNIFTFIHVTKMHQIKTDFIGLTKTQFNLENITNWFGKTNLETLHWSR